jgi:hypothetical protein
VFRSTRELQRQHARELDRLFQIIERQNDRLMYLAGRTWAAPPAVSEEAERIATLGEMIDSQRYVAFPEQLPEDYEQVPE